MNEPHDPPAEALERGYQEEDLKLRWLAYFAVALLVLGATTFVGLWWLLRSLEGDRPVDRPRSVVVDTPPVPQTPLQPRPDHDTSDKQDMNAMRDREDEIFARLGWSVDARRHHATIPESLVEKLATRPTTRGAK